MKTGLHRYKYRKQIDGKGQYGEVEIEIRFTNESSKVTDECYWKTLKESYTDFQELKIHRLWKQSALNAAELVLDKLVMTKPIEIKITDIVGLYVDTAPVHIGIAIIIGLLDLLDSPLNSIEMKEIDDFVLKNCAFEQMPNFENIPILNSIKGQSY